MENDSGTRGESERGSSQQGTRLEQEGDVMSSDEDEAAGPQGMRQLGMFEIMRQMAAMQRRFLDIARRERNERQQLQVSWSVGTPQKRGLLTKFKYIIRKMDFFFTIFLFGA